MNKKRKVFSNREDDRNAEEGNNGIFYVPIKDKADCVGILNSVKGESRRQL